MDFATRSIVDLGRELGLEDHIDLYGRDKAKIRLSAFDLPARGKGRLVLVTAMNPTPAGEGKTTMSIALAMGLRRLGENAVLALREPSLGPVFGVKGGGTGGGKASLHPADDINLHFTGDIHAVTTAHNLLSAMIDNAIFHRESFPRDEARPGSAGNGHGHASEVMAILALATGPADLEARLGRIIVGRTFAGTPVTAGALGAASAMAAVLRDALQPNLVQTLEGGPAIVHCGPFGNIAHGCNSVLATRLACRLGDFAVTEAGFGFDLGGEKFLDLKARVAGVWPRVVVIVATLRALKMQGGISPKHASEPHKAALQKGMAHLEHHLATAERFGLPAVVALNVFPDDTAAELELVERLLAERGVRVARCEGYARGGEGSLALARIVAEVARASDDAPPVMRTMYELAEPARDKIRHIAERVYGASDVQLTPSAQKELAWAEAHGAAGLPICMAKTQFSLTDDPAQVGRPQGFTITVREVRYAAGAGFLVPITGQMMTMPGLPRVPAARHIRLDASGRIRGLMQND